MHHRVPENIRQEASVQGSRYHSGTGWSAMFVESTGKLKLNLLLQMLVVDNPVPSEESVIAGNPDPEVFVWPHGLTPPLHYVRQRRWRKRKVGDKVCALTFLLLER